MHSRALILAPCFFGALVAAAAVATSTSKGCSATPVSPPPAKLICGQPGTVHADLLAQFASASAQACAANCLELSACQSSSFGKGFCSLYKESLTQMGFSQKAGSQYTYADRGCYALSCVSSTITTTASVTSTAISTATATMTVTTTATAAPPPLPTCVDSVAFKPGDLDIVQGIRVANFCNGAFAVMQDDGNFVVYAADGSVGFATNTGIYPGVCEVVSCDAKFTATGSFEVDSAGIYEFTTSTDDQGALCTFQGTSPFIVITNGAGNVVYSSG